MGTTSDTTAAAPNPAVLPSWLAALSGVVAAGAGVAIAHVLAAFSAPNSSPLVAVGGAFIDATPTWLKEWAVQTFGSANKPILIGTIAVALTLLAALAGLIARRRRAAGLAMIGLVGVVAAAAAWSRPGASVMDAVPALIGALVAVGALAWLSRARPAAPGEPGPGPQRRTVLLGALAIAGGAAVVGVVGEVFTSARRSVEAARTAITFRRPSDPAPALRADVEVPVDGVTPFRVPNEEFYRVDTALVVPAIDPSDWLLSIGGMVARPYSLTYDDLLAMPLVERDLTLTCVSNEVGGPYVGNAVWLGVRLRDVLDRAGVDLAADQLFSRSADGWTASTPIGAVLDGRDALIAVAMNGEPLPTVHGFPARLVIPGLYGYVSATKWLVSLEASTYARDEAYWTQRGWATDAPIRTMARIEVPRPLTTVAPGTTAIAGTAWAQGRGVNRVEVQVDDEPWAQATLGAIPSVDTWRQWWLPWNATPGRHTIRVRATDGDGSTQPEARLDPFPSGAQGWHEVVVTVG